MTTDRRRHRERFGTDYGEAAAPPSTPWWQQQLGGLLRGSIAGFAEIPSLVEQFGRHSGGPYLEGTELSLPTYEEISQKLKEYIPVAKREHPAAEVLGSFVGPLDVADAARLGALGAAAGIVRNVSSKKHALDMLGITNVKAITDVKLRDKSLEDAIQIARQELHIKKGTEGGLVGAPASVKNRRHLRQMRERFDETVNEGVVGADWYDRVRRYLDELSGGDPVKADRMAQELALYSAQANPSTNMGWAVELRNALQAGRADPTAVATAGEKVLPGTAVPMIKTPKQTEKAVKAFLTGRRTKQGKKTGVYEKLINPSVGMPSTGTNDIWHGRAFGYTNRDGKLFSRGFTAQEHAFLDAETVLAVDRANRRQLGGRSNWTAGEIQAAAWVQAKGASEYAKNPKKFGFKQEEAIKWASLTYPDYAKKFVGQGTYEAVPGAGTGQIQSLLTAPHAKRKEFTAAVPWTDAQGRDVIYDAFGINVGKSKPAEGIFFGPQGVETNPANVAKPLLGLTKDQGGRVVGPVSRDIMQAGEAVRSFVDIQNVGAWHKAFPFREGGVKSKAANGVWIPMDRPLNVEEMQKLADVSDELDYFISDSGEGVVLFPASYNKTPPDGIAMRKKLDGGLKEQLKEMLPESGRIDRARVDTGTVDMFQDAKEKARLVGSGQATKEVLRHLDNPRTPKLLELLDASAGFREKVVQKIMRNLEAVSVRSRMSLDQLWSDQLREDHLRALRIIAESGFAGLREALKNGQILPAVALPIFGVAFEYASDSEM